MQVHALGDGNREPDIAVVACVHGDERCGKHAIDRLLEKNPDVRKPVKLVVANEEAIEQNARYVDTDLNRVFPGDPDSDLHEERLAAELRGEIQNCTVLDLHATVSTDEPFALLTQVNDRTVRLAENVPVSRVVDISYVGGGLIDHCDGVTVECGRLGTDRCAENAYRITASFLAAHGVLNGPMEHVTQEYFRVTGRVPKDPNAETMVAATNFEQVAAGEAYAENGEPLTAEEPFYPVLMSADGYDDMLGFTAEKVEDLAGRDPLEV